MMTHHDSWRSMSMERICHLTSIFKAEKRHESPILQLHLSKSWHHGLLFDLLLDSHGNPWKCLRRKGHSLPEGEKSMGASSWASSSCPQRHETSITSRFEDGKKRYSHGHSTTSIWGDSGFAAQGIVFSRKRKSTQAWSNLNSNLQSFHVVANTLSRFTIFQSRECQRDQTFRFLRLCPRSSSARPSVGTAVHRDSKTFRTSCPILLQCDKFLQLQYATRIKHIEHYRTNSCQCTKEYTIFKAHLYHLYPLVI